MIDVNCHSERENRVEESGNNGYSNFDRSGEIFLTKSIKALLTYLLTSQSQSRTTPMIVFPQAELLLCLGQNKFYIRLHL